MLACYDSLWRSRYFHADARSVAAGVGLWAIFRQPDDLNIPGNTFSLKELNKAFCVSGSSLGVMSQCGRGLCKNSTVEVGQDLLGQ